MWGGLLPWGVKRLAVIAALALALPATAGAQTYPDLWTMDGHNAWNWRSTAGGPSPGRAVAPTKVWQRTLEGDVTGTPLILSEGIFVGTWDGLVYRLGFDGKTRRTVNLDAPIPGSLLKVGNTLYAVTSRQGDPRLYALDPRTLNCRWCEADGDTPRGVRLDSQALADAWGSPIHSPEHNLIYVPICFCEAERKLQNVPTVPPSRGSVVAVDATSGAIVRKRYTVKLKPGTVNSYTGGSVAGTPVLYNDRIYVTTGHAYNGPPNAPGTETDVGTDAIIAMDAATLEIEGVFQAHAGDISNNGDPNPTRKKGFLAPPNLIGYNTSSGVRWLIGAGARDGVYYVVDPEPTPDGKLERVWTATVGVGTSVGGIRTSAAFDQRRVIGTTQAPSALWALSPVQGALQWATPAAPGTERGPVTASSNVAWTASVDGFLEAYDANNLGRLLGKVPLGAPSIGGASVGYGTVMVGIGTGRGTGGGVAVFK